jgi:tRNA A-37 threonylcarbamoyl transferase component Bud32/tetratricopeptide (TPR) repeat protein
MDQRDVVTVAEAGTDASVDLPPRLGHFEIVGRLGAGGMGLVFEGRDALLGRRVALKLLHPSTAGGQLAPARLIREAQALARLAHPNVVTVYEVGLVGNDPFIAMELVEGVTLLDWMAEPRDWRAVLDIFIAVGHGLAAVHALGLVHRDFKPSNVLVDAHGVPKLGDFGLVGASDDPGPSVALDSSGGGDLTATGTVMGTPAYMAPEQKHGDPIDARADQYSFAKSLREALREPIPAALEPIVARAFADDPDHRFPSMEPLLHALARIRRGNRRRWLAAGGTLAVLGAVAMAWGFGRAQTTEDPCARPTARVDRVWGDARRGALDRHLAAIDAVHGQQRFAAAAAVLDRGATRWMDIHVDACQLSHEGRQSDALLDRRMACLDRALFEIDETVGVVERASNPTTLDDAMRAVVGLPALDECADVAALTDKLPRPTNPLQRTEADAIQRETVEIDVALRTGGTRTGVADRARGAVTRARALGHPETLARSLRSLAAVQTEEEAGEAVLGTLREAITAAAAAHDDRLVAELWSKLLSQLATQKQAHDAETLVPAAEAAIARTAASIELGVAFLDSKARIAVVNGKVPEAQQLLAQATGALEAAGARTPGSPLAPLLLTIRSRTATTFAAANDWARMATELKDLIPLANAQYGPDHPVVLQYHFNRGVALRHIRQEATALVEFREAARIGEARLAPSPALADLLYGVGSTLASMDNHADESLPYLERAIAMARATLPAGDPRIADQLAALASAYVTKQRYVEAKRLFEECVAIYARLARPKNANRAIALYNLGRIAYETKHCEDSSPALDDALAIYEAIGDPDHYDIDITTNLIAECQIMSRRWALAMKTTERVINSTASQQDVRVTAHFAHGRALAGSGDVRGGTAEVRAAHADMVKLGFDNATIDEAAAWLAQH